MAKEKSAQTKRREELRKEYWPDEIVWTGENEKGWFRAPRTLSLIMVLLRSKAISGKQDPTSVYLELLARHKDSAVIDMESEGEHSFAAGYSDKRGTRTWQERMKILEKHGFIKTVAAGNTRYKHVLLIHPSIAVKKLYDANKIPKKWWETYRGQQIKDKETKHEDLVPSAVQAHSTPTSAVPAARSTTGLKRPLVKRNT